MVVGIHGAFSLAVGQTFWLGVGGAIAAAIAAVAIKELPLRSSNMAPASASRHLARHRAHAPAAPRPTGPTAD